MEEFCLWLKPTYSTTREVSFKVCRWFVEVHWVVICDLMLAVRLSMDLWYIHLQYLQTQ